MSMGKNNLHYYYFSIISKVVIVKDNERFRPLQNWVTLKDNTQQLIESTLNLHNFSPEHILWLILWGCLLCAKYCCNCWMLYYLILTTRLWGRLYYHSIFTDEGTERLRNLPKVTQLRNGEARIRIPNYCIISFIYPSFNCRALGCFQFFFL